MSAPLPRARHLKAAPRTGDGCIEWDPATRRWHPAPRQHLGDRLLIGFGLLVALYFLAEFARLVPWSAVLA